MKIEIYSKPHCRYCLASTDLLTAKAIPYTEYKINQHISREDFLKKFPEAKTVPVIVIDDEWIGGFTELNTYVEKNYG